MKGQWHTLEKNDTITCHGLEESLMGGQSFSWSVLGDNHWGGAIGHIRVDLRWMEGLVEWRSFGDSFVDKTYLTNYLWMDPSYGQAIDSLPWRSDPVLLQAMKAFPGLRILRQPMDEILFVFSTAGDAGGSRHPGRSHGDGPHNVHQHSLQSQQWRLRRKCRQ